MTEHSEPIVIDVREPDEFAGGHAQGALNIPLSELNEDPGRLRGVAKDTQIIVYCRTGKRSNQAIDILKEQGFTNLENGINKDHVDNNLRA